MRVSCSALVLASLLLGSCSGGEREPPREALDRSPAPLPEGWVWELAIGGDASLARLRAVLPEGDARALFPSRVADLAGAVAGMSGPLREAALEGTPLRCIAIGDTDAPQRACALRVREGALEGRPGGPRGASWVEVGQGAAALAGDTLVVAPDRETVTRALPWLAFTALAEEPPRGVVARVAEGVASGVLRPQLDGWIAEQAREARAQVAREREAHPEAPALGEPEAVIAWLEAAASERVALLPDLGTTTLELDASEGGLSLTLRCEVREGSPLARRLAGAGGALRGLRELPPGTVLAWASTEDAASREGAASALGERLAEVGGARVGDRARAAIASALGAWAEARGDASVAALGLGEQGAWAALASWPARSIELAPLRDALAIDWADVALAMPLGCDRVDPGAANEDALAVCRGVHLARGSAGDALALVLAQGEPAQARAAASALAARIAEGRGALGSSPDVERVIGARDPDGTFFAALVVPSALPVLVGRLVPTLRERASAHGTRRGAPWLLRAHRDGTAVVVELRASREGLDDLIAMVDGLTGS